MLNSKSPWVNIESAKSFASAISPSIISVLFVLNSKGHFDDVSNTTDSFKHANKYADFTQSFWKVKQQNPFIIVVTIENVQIALQNNHPHNYMNFWKLHTILMYSRYVNDCGVWFRIWCIFLGSSTHITISLV